jgi:protein-tyrosine phosphatase
MKTILFLCTGNYFRSRYAEILFNATAIRWGIPWRAVSRGLAPECFVRNPGHIAKATLSALADKKITDITGTTRAPKAVVDDDATAATRVLALSRREHQPMVETRYPTWAAKVEYWEIEDAPDALAKIESNINVLIASLLGGGGEGSDPTAVAKKEEKPKKPITLKVGREIAGRRGKGVVTIFDTPLGESQLKELCATLKNKVGTGGTVKDGVIEIQGDQRDRVITELEKLGYTVKKVGG